MHIPSTAMLAGLREGALYEHCLKWTLFMLASYLEHNSKNEQLPQRRSRQVDQTSLLRNSIEGRAL